MVRAPTDFSPFPHPGVLRSCIIRTSSPATGASRFTYSPGGNLLTAENADGQKLLYRYDASRRLRQVDFGDRKSTRLNSSHSQISYAVFCLKKKNSHDLRM